MPVFAGCCSVALQPPNGKIKSKVESGRPVSETELAQKGVTMPGSSRFQGLYGQIIKRILTAAIIAVGITAVTAPANAQFLTCTPIAMHYGAAAFHFKCSEGGGVWLAVP